MDQISSLEKPPVAAHTSCMAETSLTSVIYNQLPCLSCSDPRCDRIKTRLGALLLQVLRDERPEKLPTLDQLLHGCCQRPSADDGRMIFVMPSADRLPKQPAPKRRW